MQTVHTKDMTNILFPALAAFFWSVVILTTLLIRYWRKFPGGAAVRLILLGTVTIIAFCLFESGAQYYSEDSFRIDWRVEAIRLGCGVLPAVAAGLLLLPAISMVVVAARSLLPWGRKREL